MSSSIIDRPILKQKLQFNLGKTEHYLFSEVHFLRLPVTTPYGIQERDHFQNRSLSWWDTLFHVHPPAHDRSVEFK